MPGLPIRLDVLLLVPIQDAHDGSPGGYRKPKLRCLADAFEDRDCAELLE